MRLAATVRALEQDPELSIRAFGHPDALSVVPVVADSSTRSRFEGVAVDDVVAMDATPSQALRSGRSSSMAAALKDVAGGNQPRRRQCGQHRRLDGAGRFLLGTLPGVERPALMTAFPVRGGRAWVLDLGANIGVDADRLLEFAQLGSAAVQVLLKRTPRVGLLNIGSEATKGTDVIREAARRIADEPNLNYIGFVEGHDVFAGRADVVVCDGFAGNVLLKSAEGAIRMLLGELSESARRPLHGLGLRGPLRRLAERYDPARHNGATLLGINGIVVKSHAHASVDGLVRAIQLAAVEARGSLVAVLESQLWTET
jgi:glycerol-3-phosphate acyltransferase PlsX